MTDTLASQQTAIREVLANYALNLDAEEIDDCLSLFAADAEFLVYGRSFAGHDGIGAMLRDAPRGLHLTGASRIDIRGDIAMVRSQVLFVRADNLRLRPALYDDELVREEGRWRFRRRRCRFITSDGLTDSPEVQ